MSSQDIPIAIPADPMRRVPHRVIQEHIDNVKAYINYMENNAPCHRVDAPPHESDLLLYDAEESMKWLENLFKID